jgi:hypothetical protein
MVLVGFIEGQKNSGIIVCTIPHPSDDAVEERPTQADGKTWKGEFQGLQYQIKADGSLTLTYNGPRDANGQFGDTGPTTVNIDGQGNVNVSTNNDQSVVIDRVNQKITATNGDTSFTMDNEEGQIRLVADQVQTGGPDNLQPQVVGNDWKDLMSDLIDQIVKIVVPTGTGPSGTPVNAAAFQQIQERLSSALSTKHVVEK